LNFPKLGGLARSTIKVFFWHGARLVTQLFWVVVLARALGAAGYGGFTGVASLAMVLSGLVGIGLALRMFQDVARDTSIYALRWHQAWRVTIGSGVGISLLFVGLAGQLLEGYGLGLFIAIAVSELLLIPIAAQVAFAYAAHGRIERSAAIPVIISLFRVLASLVFLSMADSLGLGDYAWMHLAATATAVGIILMLKRRELPVDPVPASIDLADLRSGAGFSAVWASGIALNSIDKVVALRAGGAELAGHYAVAYRFSSIMALPVDALVAAVMPRLFRAGAGMSEHPKLVGILGAIAAGYGLLAGALIWFAAYFVPFVLGPDFESVVAAMGLMAAFVPLYCVRIVGVNALLAFGFKRWRFLCETFTLIVLVVLGLWRIPVAGLEGAVQALVMAETLLVVLVWPRMWNHRSSTLASCS
jgi:O-antigen/teichoic acid export membrane protein